MFTCGVAKGRGVSLSTVLSDFGQGRMLMAEDAVAVGMADEVNTLDGVLSELGAFNVSDSSDEGEDEGDDEEQASRSEYRPECDEDSDLYDPDECDQDDDDDEDDADARRRDALRIRALFDHRLNA